MSSGKTIPIWYFVGLLLLVYGVIILASGLYQISHPAPTVLNRLQPAVWWGALLTIMGAVYVFVHRPGRNSKE